MKFSKNVEYAKYLDGYITEAERWRNPGKEQKQEQEEKSEKFQLFIEKVVCQKEIVMQDDLKTNEKNIVKKTTYDKKVIGSTKQYKDSISSNDLMQIQQSLVSVKKSLRYLLKDIEK